MSQPIDMNPAHVNNSSIRVRYCLNEIWIPPDITDTFWKPLCLFSMCVHNCCTIHKLLLYIRLPSVEAVSFLRPHQLTSSALFFTIGEPFSEGALKSFYKPKYIRKFKFYVWIIISGVKSVKIGIFLKKPQVGFKTRFPHFFCLS